MVSTPFPLISFVEVGEDETEGKPFLKSEFNMYGDSYRSPWSNRYFPMLELEDGEENEVPYPSGDLLEMEQLANATFARYAKLYYDRDFLTSVYFFDQEHNANGFGSCWLVKKTMPFPGAEVESVWDATHVVTTVVEKDRLKYTVNSTVFLLLNANQETQGTVDIAGCVAKTKEDLYPLDPKQPLSQQHIKWIGKMIESNETEMRTEMNAIFINKSKQIINTGRLRDEYMSKDEKSSF